jgi:hypothetical protein
MTLGCVVLPISSEVLRKELPAISHSITVELFVMSSIYRLGIVRTLIKLYSNRGG